MKAGSSSALPFSIKLREKVARRPGRGSHPERTLKKAYCFGLRLESLTGIGNDFDFPARTQMGNRIGYGCRRLQTVPCVGRVLVHSY